MVSDIRARLGSRGNLHVRAGGQFLAVAATLCACASLRTFVGSFSSGASFVSPRSSAAIVARLPPGAGRTALRAEAGDADEVAKGTASVSVFDAPQWQQETFKKKYDGQVYTVNKKDWTFVVEKTGYRGAWARAWSMPEMEFKKNEKRLRQQWRAKKRQLRRKHGNMRYPDGKFIFLAKLQGNPFTREKYGEKYIGRPEFKHPNDLKGREQQKRAMELKRKLEQQAEEVRVARMKELNVWLGDIAWRRPWQAKADYIEKDIKTASKEQRVRGMTQAEADVLASRMASEVKSNQQ